MNWLERFLRPPDDGHQERSDAAQERSDVMLARADKAINRVERVLADYREAEAVALDSRPRR